MPKAQKRSHTPRTRNVEREVDTFHSPKSSRSSTSFVHQSEHQNHKDIDRLRLQALNAERSSGHFVRNTNSLEPKKAFFSQKNFSDYDISEQPSKRSGHSIVSDDTNIEEEYKKALKSVNQSITLLHSKYGKSHSIRRRIAEDLSRDVQGDYKIACPETAPLLWKDVEKDHKNPAKFACLTYAYYRTNGMKISDILKIDPYLYKKFTNWCYYRGIAPKDIFEDKNFTHEQKETVSSEAIAEGIIAEEVVRCPKKSEIGKTLTEAEFRHQRRMYENQLARIRRRRGFSMSEL